MRRSPPQPLPPSRCRGTETVEDGAHLQGTTMPRQTHKAEINVATTIALASSVSTVALAQAQNTTHTIARNESIFIDGKALTVTQGTSKDDVGAQVARLGAREVGPGAIIFRANDKLYIVDAPPLPLYALDDRQQSYGGLNHDRQPSYAGLHHYP